MDESYNDKLPQAVSGHTCQSLAPEGELCGAPAVQEVSMHGDSGMHEDAWVAVFLCAKHAKLMLHPILMEENETGEGN